MSGGVCKTRILAVDDHPFMGLGSARSNWPSSTAALLVSLICVSLFVGTVYALDPNKHLTQYIHSSWRTEDGSAPGGMLSITQTADGFLWFTSISERMFRFDGVRFLPWTLNLDGRRIDHVVSVDGDHAGGLWAIEEHEVVHVRGGVVTSHFAVEGQARTENISEDIDGSLWILQAGSSLNAPLCHVTDQAMKCFGESDGLRLPTGGEALLPDGKAGFWLGGQRAVAHWREGSSEVYPIEALKSYPGNGVAALAFDADASLWVGLLPQGRGKGLGQLEKGVFKSFVTRGFDGSKLAVIAMHLDHDGNLWVGTASNGVFRIHGSNVEHYGRAEGLSSDSVNGLFEDREGILWVTTSNGIDSFRDPPVATFSALEGLGPDDAAAGVLASRDGTIWIANGGSLDRIERNGAISSIRWGKGLPGEQVAAMFEDRASNLWLGVYDGLYLLKNGRFRRIPEPDHQPLGLVVGITEDVEGNIWAECLGKSRKLIRLRDFQVREQFPSSRIPVGRIAADPHGGIWIGTRSRNAITLFRDGVQKEFPIGSTANLQVNYLAAQADGSVLAAFDDGLVGLRRDKVQRMTTKNGLPCNTIYSFIEDKQRQWWLLAECGILELPDSELQRWWANPEAALEVRLYDALDGARPGRFGLDSAALSGDGRVWFATGYFVQMLDPSRLSQKAPPPQTYIESVTVDRKEFAASSSLKISPHPRELQIDYTSPTFAVPQKLKFHYKLEGYDRDWHEAGTRRQAFYTDLRPGKYSFRVIASNSDGVWNDTAAKLDFSIAPAYYQTNWFRALCAFAFLALLWAVYQWRVRQLQHHFDLTLDARVGERTRIARELHDTLLQSAHGVLLRFQVVSQLLPNRATEAKEKLDNAIEETAEFITEARDQVQALRVSTVQGNDLARAISTLGEELTTDSTNHRPTFRVAVEGESRNVHPIIRDEIYKIAAEALRNAFRHSQARQIEVEIRYDNEQFRFRVRDDGKGIDPAVLERKGTEGHYGLQGMRERAALIEGKLVVWSEVDAGTEVELRLPASKAYDKAGKRAWLSRKAKA